MPRRAMRKDADLFPSAYSNLLRKFRDGGEVAFPYGPFLDERSARARVRDFYRYFSFLRDQRERDPTSRELSEIARNVTLAIGGLPPAARADGLQASPPKGPDDNGQWWITVMLNPAEAAWRHMQTPTERSETDAIRDILARAKSNPPVLPED